jgi:hypothetical protein
MSNSPLIDLLKEVISTELHLLPINNTIDIEEKQLQANCRFVKIRLKQSMPYFGFSIDIPKGTGNVDPIYPFFAEKEGLRRKNDAILFFQKSHKIYVLLVELKSVNKGDYLKQMKAAKCFVEFILCRIKLLKSPPNIDSDNIEFRGALFSCRRIPNEGTTERQRSIDFKDRNGLLVTENAGNQLYHIKDFLK